MGYRSPTPVQRAVFEPAAEGKSLVVQARTGTGKTAAFALPIVDRLVRPNVKAVQALALCPTRELALQVSRELEALGKYRGIKVVAVYGGASMAKQLEALAGGAQVVVGTPGRTLDHLRQKTLDPSSIRVLVLDEADEMLSMGFARELHAILDLLPKNRQGLFFSATIPPDIERLAQNQLRDPELITLSSDQVGALEVAHYVYVTQPGDKVRSARADHRGRGPGERRRFLQHAGRDRARRRGPEEPRLRRRLAERRPAAARPRARDGGDPRGPPALPRRHRRGRAGHRHLAPDARHQLRLPGDGGTVRAPHGADGARRAHGDGDRAGGAGGHREPLPAAPHLPDPPHRASAPERRRAEDARGDGPPAALRRGLRQPPGSRGRPVARSTRPHPRRRRGHRGRSPPRSPRRPRGRRTGRGRRGPPRTQSSPRGRHSRSGGRRTDARRHPHGRPRVRGPRSLASPGKGA